MDRAKSYAEKGNFKEAARLCEKAEKTYAKREKLLSAFVNRGDLNEIGISIASLSPMADKDSGPEFLSRLSEARISIEHLKNDQSPSTQSLF